MGPSNRERHARNSNGSQRFHLHGLFSERWFRMFRKTHRYLAGFCSTTPDIYVCRKSMASLIIANVQFRGPLNRRFFASKVESRAPTGSPFVQIVNSSSAFIPQCIRSCTTSKQSHLTARGHSHVTDFSRFPPLVERITANSIFYPELNFPSLIFYRIAKRLGLSRVSLLGLRV